MNIKELEEFADKWQEKLKKYYNKNESELLNLYDVSLFFAKSKAMTFNFELLLKKCITLFSSQDFLKKINWNQQQGNYAVLGCT